MLIGNAKISDFGLSMKLNYAGQSSCQPDKRGVGGTAGWQAPEQLLHSHGQTRDLRKRTDVFSLGLSGVALHHMM